MGFSKQYGCQLMRGSRKISIDHLIKIAEVLDVNSASLLPVENPMQKIEFEDYIWNAIKEKLDKYLDERLKKI